MHGVGEGAIRWSTTGAVVCVAVVAAIVSYRRLARCLLGLGIAATPAANAAHGLDHGPVGALVAAWRPSLQ